MFLAVHHAALVLVVLAVAALPGRAQAPPPGPTLPPSWTSREPGGLPIYLDRDVAVVAQIGDLRVFLLSTGKLAWSKKFDPKPAEVGACHDFVAVRVGALVTCYDTRTGAEIHKIAGVDGMQMAGKRLVCAHSGSTQQHDPLAPKATPKSIPLTIPIRRSTDPGRGAHLGRRIVWRLDEATLAAFDLETFSLAWRSSWEFFHYIAIPDVKVTGLDKDAKPVEVTVWDEAHGYYVSGDHIAVHASRLLEIPKSSGAPKRGDYVWFLDAKAGGGPRFTLDRSPDDRPDPPLISWSGGPSKPTLVARWMSSAVAGEYRFDLYPARGARSCRTGYVPYDTLVPGARGQLVGTRATDLDSFQVLALPKLAPAWTGRGWPVPRAENDTGPYLVLRFDAATNAAHLDQLEPADGTSLATLALGGNRWELVPGSFPGHLLFRGRDGELARVETSPLAVTHRFLLPGLSEKFYPIDSKSFLVRVGDKLARIGFEANGK